MAEPRIQLGQNPAFERFLGAIVGEDARGANVTVLSMFARLGVDPWDEASALAALPRGRARTRLGSLMGGFRDVPGIPDPDILISRLLELLPNAAVAQPIPQNITAARMALSRYSAPIFWIAGAILVIVYITYLAQVN